MHAYLKSAFKLGRLQGDQPSKDFYTPENKHLSVRERIHDRQSKDCGNCQETFSVYRETNHAVFATFSLSDFYILAELG